MPRRSPERKRAPLPAGFGTIWSTVAIDLVGFGIILPVLPLYAERYGASPATIGLLLASFSIAQLLLAPVWGAVSDRVGRKPVLVLSLAGTAVGSLVTGLAGALPLLFVGRLLDGASGASVSVAQASAADLAGPGQRARLFGLLGAAFGVGFVAGPALGSLAALVDPRLPFFVAAALAGMNAVVATRRLPETNPRHVSARAERPVAVADGIGAEGMGGLDPGAAVDPDSDTSGERRSPDGRRVAVAPGPGLTRLVVVGFGSLVAFSAFEATFALFGERRLGFGLASTGAVFTAIGLMLALVEGGLVHPAVRRLGEVRALRLALAVNAVGLVLLAAVHSWWVLVPALAALILGQGLATPSLTAATASVASESRRGGVLGLQQSAGGLARVVGPLLGGLAFQHIGIPAPYLGGAAIMVVCALVLG
ncbi:MAG TPA: MFS transporter [Acidimicrobiales bacterium]|nr:MFS transporter [Acidimicrobiales bacterium]